MSDINLMDTYELHETLGAGGGGTVIKAYHKRLQKDVVIKKIHADIQDENERRVETDILKNLHHQYLPQVLDYFVVDGIGYTVMDYVQGESFGQKLARGERFSEKKVLKYAKQICEALDYLHSQKLPVIHGDIKPDNIMLTPEDNVCLIDFNISGITREGHAVTFGYTEGYGAPEQYREFQRLSALIAEREAIPSEGAGRTELLGQTSGGAGRTEILGQESGGAGRTELLGQMPGGAGRTELLGQMPGGAGRTELLGQTPGGAGRTEILRQESGGAGRTELLGQVPGGAGRTEKLGGHAAGSATEKLNYGNLDGAILAGQSVNTSAGMQQGDTAGMQQSNAAGIQQGNVPQSQPAALPQLTEGIPIDKRSDIYSLGATLFHIYTGQVLSRDARNQISSRTSEGFLYILNKALQEDPGNRYQDAGQMLAAVNNLYKHDSRYRNMKIRHALAYIALVGVLLGGIYLVLRGRNVYENELLAKYDEYMEELAGIRAAGDPAEFETLFEEAADFMPDRLEAYYQKALFLYETGQYQESINFVRKTLDGNSDFYSQGGVGDMYYIMGTSYFELLNYESASNAFANAIKYNGENPIYYVDQAIAFARIGNVSAAKEVLETAEAKGALSDNIYLVSGEIKLAEEDYEGAEEDFRMSMAEAGDDYTCMRAYVMCSKAILGKESSTEAVEEGIELLNEALAQLPNEYHAMLLEQLAGMYIAGYEATEDVRYAEGVLDTLKKIEAAGWASFTTYDNMVNIYYRIGDYAAEEQLLEELAQKYPDNYKVPMKRAFLEGQLQSEKPLEERDYSGFVTYYELAQELYSTVKRDGWSDSEMQVLENAYQELVDGHWIE